MYRGLFFGSYPTEIPNQYDGMPTNKNETMMMRNKSILSEKVIVIDIFSGKNMISFAKERKNALGQHSKEEYERKLLFSHTHIPQKT